MMDCAFCLQMVTLWHNNVFRAEQELKSKGFFVVEEGTDVRWRQLISKKIYVIEY